jgi:uncharacterized membrane protein YgdD (TMEM256/DUF423 family)
MEGGTPAVERVFFVAGALLGFTGVIAGALGTHVLQERIAAEQLDGYRTATSYQMYHALALLAVAWALSRWEHGALTVGGWLFLVGTLLFSGSIYLLVLGGPRWLGPVTPVGGLALMIGWLAIAWGVSRG